MSSTCTSIVGGVFTNGLLGPVDEFDQHTIYIVEMQRANGFGTHLTDDCEHIWKVRYENSEVAAGPGLPVLCQGKPFAPLNPYLLEVPINSVEACGKDQDI